MSSDYIKPYTLISFDERKNRELKFEKNPELIKAFEKAKKEGYEKGYEEGFNKGLESGYNEGFKSASEEIRKKEITLNEKIEALNKIITEVSQFKYEQIKTFLPEILSLCLKIAKKVIATEISINKEALINIIKEALKEVTLEEVVTIKINPLDSEKLSEEINILTAENRSIRIVTTPEIIQGGCHIETQSQLIDASIDEKLREIENAFNSLIYSKD